MKAGDIITHINGKEVKSANDVYNIVQAKQQLTLTVVRGAASEVTKIVVMPEEIEWWREQVCYWPEKDQIVKIFESLRQRLSMMMEMSLIDMRLFVCFCDCESIFFRG